VTAPDFRNAIRQRAEAADVQIDDELVSACADYLRLLAAWNVRINLTALKLEPPVPELTIDRLIVEPIMAARWISSQADWIDLGSGGGSPALPLKLARPTSRVTLVEARERKCAFLREAIRALRIPAAQVVQTRFEALTVPEGAYDAVTVRAVRLDKPVLDLIHRLLRQGGSLITFGALPDDDRFKADTDRRPALQGIHRVLKVS
jgi:16S rRNA (guanine527-N7)-methyltransferase